MEQAIEQLITADSLLAKVINSVGELSIRPQRGYDVLAYAIINQQLSKAAAKSITNRIHEKVRSHKMPVGTFLSLSIKELRECGLAHRKIEFLRNLDLFLGGNRLSFCGLGKLNDEEIIERLTTLKGIGLWTAQMYLIFSLGRPNVFPVTDAALVAVIREVYTIPKNSDASCYQLVADNWKPFSSIASRYLWAFRDASRQ